MWNFTQLNRYLVTIFAIAAFPILSSADVPAPFGTGSRLTPDVNGVHATESWGSGGKGFKISWDISVDLITHPGYAVHYIYNITSASGGSLSKDISHVILEVSKNSNIPADFVFGKGYNVEKGDPLLYTSQQGNPLMPGSIFGIKFTPTEENNSKMKIEFWSTRDPVWGDFYARDGKQNGNFVVAYNTGFLSNPADVKDGNYIPWIPRPDTTHHMEIPEPTTMLLLGSGLSFATLYRKRRMAKK